MSGTFDTMKVVLAALLGTSVLPLISGSTAADTSTQLLESCQAVINAAGGKQSATVDIPITGIPCWYYMAAIQNMSVVVDQHGQNLLGVCAPQDTTLMQYVRIFANYAQKHRGQDDDNAAALAVRALVAAFPCGKRGPA